MNHILNHLIKNIPIRQTVGDVNLTIRQIHFDSRRVEEGDVFIALKGTQVDGHRFISNAIEKGAKAIVAEHFPTELTDGVTFIKVDSTHFALGQMANLYYDEPSKKLKLVGITGTNGKTTTATLLHQLFMDLGYKTGLLSTIENKIGQKVVPASHTTPDALALNELLSDMVEAGCDFAFMEVSSHAVHQERIAGIHFTGAVFTNITHDHLDYHKTFRAYIDAKKKFFDDLPKSAFALTNLDDRRGEVMLQNTKAKKKTYALRKPADYKAKILENNLTGLIMDMDGQEFFSPLSGTFNGYNLLAVYTTAVLLEQDKMEALKFLSQLKAVEGRFDYILDKQNNRVGIVDYAHTPDALEKVLSTIDKIRTGNEKVITVVGCGGDRDKVKRPLMAKIACNFSQLVILTSDNPRTENPDTIISDMEEGIPKGAERKVLSIALREQAIKTACQLAQKGDIILVAGKGHEKYQEVNGVKYPFDDKEMLKKYLVANSTL